MMRISMSSKATSRNSASTKRQGILQSRSKGIRDALKDYIVRYPVDE